jgi:hypothetical protein
MTTRMGRGRELSRLRRGRGYQFGGAHHAVCRRERAPACHMRTASAYRVRSFLPDRAAGVRCFRPDRAAACEAPDHGRIRTKRAGVRAHCGRNGPGSSGTGRNGPDPRGTVRNGPDSRGTGRNGPDPRGTGRNPPDSPGSGRNRPDPPGTGRNRPDPRGMAATAIQSSASRSRTTPARDCAISSASS